VCKEKMRRGAPSSEHREGGPALGSRTALFPGHSARSKSGRRESRSGEEKYTTEGQRRVSKLPSPNLRRWLGSTKHPLILLQRMPR
jgi:hypothetical protein